MSKNGVIGDGSNIPWDIPQELSFFKSMTLNHMLLVGCKTFESIGGPLPDRDMIVLSRTLQPSSGVHLAKNLSSLVTLLRVLFNKNKDSLLWIGGGAEIYEQMLPLCSEVYVSHIHGNFSGDVFFPKQKLKMFHFDENILEEKEFTVRRYSSNESR